MAKLLKEEPIATDTEGQPILGFVIQPDELAAFTKEFDLIAKGRPYTMATKVEDGKLKVKIWGMVLTVSQANQMLKELEDRSQVKGFASFDMEPSGITFGRPRSQQGK